MGHRANFVIGNADNYRLFYSHWAAISLTSDLFWGYQHAINFVCQQRVVDPANGWLDTIWAEGGAVIDYPNQVLLLFGGEEIYGDVPLRRLYLKMLEVSWDGWDVRWAHQGIVDLAEYVGLDPQQVEVDSNRDEEFTMDLSPPEDPSWVRCVGTIRTDQGLQIYPLEGLESGYLPRGPRILELAEDINHFNYLNLEDYTPNFPECGFHIDLTKQRLDYWTADGRSDLQHQIPQVWSGWETFCHLDHYEKHLSLTDPELTFPVPSQSELLERLVAILDRDSEPFDILNLVEKLAHHVEGEIQVSSYALRDDRVSLDAPVRKEILARCVSALAQE